MPSRKPRLGKSLADEFPDLAAEWHPTKNGGLTPYDFGAGSHEVVWWLGRCGHEWDDNPGHRSHGRGCPLCSGKRIVTGVNDLATTHPEIAAQWHPSRNGSVSPDTIGAGSHKKVWWQDHGHEWIAIVDNRTRHNHGCSVCRGFTVQVGVNDLASQFPEIASEWDEVKNKKQASAVLSGSRSKGWFVCPLGHEFAMTIKHRTTRTPPQGCPVCANRVILVGFNDLATTSPAVAAEWHPTKNGTLTPEQVTRGSGKRVWWVCEERHEWRATVNDRNRFACPTCSATGFSAYEDGWVYLLLHETWQMQKVGITNHPDQRLKQHGHYGWEVSEMRGPMPGDQARAIERASLNALRTRGAELGNGSKPRFNGHSEAWPMSSLTLQSLAELMEWIREGES